MKKLLILICFTIMAAVPAFADTVTIKNFEVRENPYQQSQVSIVATDTAHATQSNVNGKFVFTLNGFDDTLKFTDGVAFYKKPIERSTFLYARHVNDKGTLSMLYYIYRSESKLVPVHISWIVLLAIPLGLILLAYMFKRFIIIAIIIFAIFLFFNYHNNLSIPTFFQSIVDGLKGLF